MRVVGLVDWLQIVGKLGEVMEPSVSLQEEVLVSAVALHDWSPGSVW